MITADELRAQWGALAEWIAKLANMNPQERERFLKWCRDNAPPITERKHPTEEQIRRATHAREMDTLILSGGGI